jgi:hypothetical protein
MQVSSLVLVCNQNFTRVADKIYKKKRSGGEGNNARTSKGSYPPNLPMIEEAPGREPSGLRI